MEESHIMRLQSVMRHQKGKQVTLQSFKVVTKQILPKHINSTSG